MKSIASILVGVVIVFLFSASTPCPPSKNLPGKWKCTWSNKRLSKIQMDINWQLNKDGTGKETNILTDTIQGAKSKIVVEYPLMWKATEESDGRDFLTLDYGSGKMTLQQSKTLPAGDINIKFADSLIKIKSSTHLKIQYFYYAVNMFYINDYLDGAATRTNIARLQFKKR